MEEEIYLVEGITGRIKRTPGAVYNLVLRKKIPHRKVAGRLMFLESEIKAWIDQAPGVRLNEVIEE